MIFEITNPSDALTLEAETDLLAGAAVLVLGGGRFGLRRDGVTVMPVFLFGGHEKWLAERGVDDLSAWLRENARDVAAVLDAVVYGSPSERREIEDRLFELPPGARAAELATWNDAKRTSMSDIGRSAATLAKRLREIAAEAEAAHV